MMVSWRRALIAAPLILVAGAGPSVRAGEATAKAAPPPPCSVTAAAGDENDGDGVVLTVQRCAHRVQRIELRVQPPNRIFIGGITLIGGRPESQQPVIRQPRRYLVEARIKPALRSREVFRWEGLMSSSDPWRLHVRLDAGVRVYGLWLTVHW